MDVYSLLDTNVTIVNRARNSAIRESILAMILVASRYENQSLSLNLYVVNATVTQNFDYRKSKRNSTPGKNRPCKKSKTRGMQITIYYIRVQIRGRSHM